VDPRLDTEDVGNKLFRNSGQH